MKDQIVYISPGARIFIAITVIFIFLCSATLVGYLLLNNPSGLENIVTAGISLAQTCATAVGFLVVIFFSRFSANLDDLRQKSDRLFETDLPASFALIDYEMAEPSKLPSSDLARNGRTEVLTGFVRGTNLAKYRIGAHGTSQDLGVMMNVRRLVVSYQFGPDFKYDSEAVKAVFAYVIAGAEHSGYQMQWTPMAKDHYGEVRVELRAMRNLDEDFLVNPILKLFICNDLAIMTRAVMRCRLSVERMASPANDAVAM